MPGFNQRGPMGQGPMSGKRMGKCTDFGTDAKNNETANENSPETNTTRTFSFGFGKGMGKGRGMGMGRQHRFRNGQ